MRNEPRRDAALDDDVRLKYGNAKLETSLRTLQLFWPEFALLR